MTAGHPLGEAVRVTLSATDRLPLSRQPGAGSVLLALTVLGTVAATFLDLRVPGSHRAAVDVEPGWTAGVPGIAMAWAGRELLVDGRCRRLGFVLAGFGLWWSVDGVAGSWLTYATLDDSPLTGASAAFWVYQRLGAGLLMVLPLVLVLYPDDRLPQGRWRGPALVGCWAMALLPLVLVTVPAEVAQDVAAGGPLPRALGRLELDTVTLPLPEPVWRVLLRLAYLSLAVSLLPALAVVVHRYRQARDVDRSRMRWLLWAAVVDVLVMGTSRALPDALASAGLTVAVVVTAGSVAVGILRPGLVDVDRLLGGTLLYAALLVLTLALDALVIGLAGVLVGGRIDSGQALLLAVLVVAAVYAPLRHWFWRQVRRRVVGERENPYAVVSTLAARLEDSTASTGQLGEVARSVATAFRSAYVGVEVSHSTGRALLVEHGARPAETRSLPITYRGERIGRLLLPASGAVANLRPADERLLADVVRQGAAAARADQLAVELQQSRERLVTVVEDERRRLRRDLHDGLGPALAAVASRIDTARITARRDPEVSDESLVKARQELNGLLAEVRRLVHGLRPPALDDVGLVHAIRQLVPQLASPDLAVEVDSPDELAGLPAAAEVAAFRIVSEALTNVVRHSHATHCAVDLELAAGHLTVEVVDDGVGIDEQVRAGVGLLSLRERAEELGGRAEVLAHHPRGTRVRAVLPVSERREGAVS